MLGPLPTPGIAQLTQKLQADLGVVISASHNLFDDNGIKLFDADGYKLSDETEARIEELIDELKQNFTIVIVTHSMQQAARVSKRTAFFHLGDLVETGDTDQIFTAPSDNRTQDYITGRFG